MGNNNGGNRITRINEAHNRGKGNILNKNDADYLSWMRLGANNKQILELRDELRYWREAAEEINHNMETHELLKQEAQVILRMLGYYFHYAPFTNVESVEEVNGMTVEDLRVNSKQARDNIPDPSMVTSIDLLDQDDLNKIGGMRFFVAATDDGLTWVLQMEKGEHEDGQ